MEKRLQNKTKQTNTHAQTNKQTNNNQLRHPPMVHASTARCFVMEASMLLKIVEISTNTRMVVDVKIKSYT